MKTLLALLIPAAALSGCVIAPIEPAPVVYAAPPAVVVTPRPYYAYPRHQRWHRHWR